VVVAPVAGAAGVGVGVPITGIESLRLDLPLQVQVFFVLLPTRKVVRDILLGNTPKPNQTGS
jgi:hypothetical protein